DPRVLDRVRRERYWGRLVEEKPGPEGTEVTLLESSIEWLASWVFSFGSMAEALSPKRLRELVAMEAQKVAARYAELRPFVPSFPPLPADQLTKRSGARATLARVS